MNEKKENDQNGKSQKERSLYEQFIYTQRLFGRHYLITHRTQGPMGNPYRGQGRVLKLLKLQPEMSQRDLLELLDMRPQSLGELLAKLEHRGFITRFQSEEDKRVMMVRITEKGEQAVNQEEERPDFDDLFNCLSEEEQANLSDYISRITEELEKRFADEKDWAGRHLHDHLDPLDHFSHRGHGRHRRYHDFDFPGYGDVFYRCK